MPRVSLNHIQLIGLWSALVLSSICLRPLLPVDETRYLSVAWEMWTNGSYLVPIKNGLPYADKPPMYFWLINLGWGLFGVNEWWPRLISPLLALICIPLVIALAKTLWPEKVYVGRNAVWLLFGGLFWSVFMTLVQFDLLLVVCTLMGMLGWLHMESSKKFSFLPALAIGLGILSKGPVILIHLLPVSLLAPIWLEDQGNLSRWYRYVLFSVLIGLAIGLAWAVPAAISGGEAYREEIFWGQTAERVVNSFAHQKAWWWYLAILPLLLFPWIAWPVFWRGIISTESSIWKERSVKFLLCWILPGFILFSLISGKQIKYLLPMMPAFMLLVAYFFDTMPGRNNRLWLAGMLLLGAGLLLVSLPVWVKPDAYWVSRLNPFWGDLLIVFGLITLFFPGAGLFVNIQAATVSVVIVVLSLSFCLRHVVSEAYDLKTVGEKISGLMAEGKSLAYLGTYHAEFNYLGRLNEPIKEIPEKNAIAWAKTHPDSYLVLHRADWPHMGTGALYEQPYRSRSNDLGLWLASDWLQALPENLVN